MDYVHFGDFTGGGERKLRTEAHFHLAQKLQQRDKTNSECIRGHWSQILYDATANDQCCRKGRYPTVMFFVELHTLIALFEITYFKLSVNSENFNPKRVYSLTTIITANEQYNSHIFEDPSGCYNERGLYSNSAKIPI